MGSKERDGWDKADVILKPVGGFLTALAVAGIGIGGSIYLGKRQKTEEDFRLYSELMSKREEADSVLRREMVGSIIETFIKPNAASLEAKMMSLELLAYNFHESIDLKPFFSHLKKLISDSDDAAKKEYISRLYEVARNIVKKQMMVLEQAGEIYIRQINLDELRKEKGGIVIIIGSLTLDNIERYFKIRAIEVISEEKKIKVSLLVKSVKPPDDDPITQMFSVGFFDFPMTDNIRLSHDQRCAVVLNGFGKKSANITLVYFPGTHASLKDKPSYNEVLQKLRAKKKEKE